MEESAAVNREGSFYSMDNGPAYAKLAAEVLTVRILVSPTPRWSLPRLAWRIVLTKVLEQEKEKLYRVCVEGRMLLYAQQARAEDGTRKKVRCAR